MQKIISTVALLTFLPCSLIAFAATEKGPLSDISIKGHILQPAELPAPDVSKLKVPVGFKIEKVAEALGNTRMLAIGPNGNLYVTRRDEGDVLMIPLDSNGTTKAKPIRVVSRSGVHGITFHEGKVYLATVKEVFRSDVLPDGTFAPLEMIIHDLPDAGQHNNRTLRVGPDNMLYISAGSTCNECQEANPENATILRSTLDGKQRSIFASGLRNTIGFDWNPTTKQLWGMDHGIDWLGDDAQKEELNLIEQGKSYGWPYFFGDNEENVHQKPPGELNKAEWKKVSQPMAMGYTAHAAPMQMAFYNASQFPTEYRGDAFIAMRGSWNRKPASGYEIMRIHFVDGKPRQFIPFVTGLLSTKGQFGRPAGLVIGKDGSLFFTDDRNGVIYRVTNVKGKLSQASSSPMPTQDKKISLATDNLVQPLAMERPETNATSSITVTSPSFKNSEAIPKAYSAYEEDFNFMVEWTKAAASTKSYVLIMEDPDSKKPPLPVAHWLAWNIPADTNSIREGLKKQERLTDPVGLRQGVNTVGKVGYFGPKPPAGDQPHRYHVQVFAIDQLLDLPVGADREKLVKAMNGHVIAKGELVGTFESPSAPTKP